MRGTLGQTVELQDADDVAPEEVEAAWVDEEDDDWHDRGDDGGDEDAGAEGEARALCDGGDRDDAGAAGELHALCDGGGGGAALSVAKADIVCEHSSRISALQKAAWNWIEQAALVAAALRHFKIDNRVCGGQAASSEAFLCDAGVGRGGRMRARGRRVQKKRRTRRPAMLYGRRGRNHG